MSASWFPTPEHRFWLHDPEGEGLVFYSTEDERNAAAELAIDNYNMDGWDECVEQVCAGVLTHVAECRDREYRPETLDDDGCDPDTGLWWGDPDWLWRGQYKLESVAAGEQGEGDE